MKKTGITILTVVLVAAVTLLIVNMVQKDNTEKASEQEVEDFKKSILKENEDLFKKRDLKKEFEPTDSIISKNANENLSLSLDSTSDPKIYRYTIKNVGDKPEILEFTSSQRYDYEIIDKTGKVVYRYSDGRSFMQVLKDVPVKPGEELTFDIQLPELEPGEYKLVMYIAARKMAYAKKTIDITVEE